MAKNKKKLNKKESIIQLEEIESEEDMPQIQQNSEMKKALYQDSQENVTSKDMEVNGGFELSRKRAKPINLEPLLDRKKIFLDTKMRKAKREKTNKSRNQKTKSCCSSKHR